MSVEDRISQFTDFFRAEINNILRLSLSGDAGHLHRYRKTLLVTVLDCLAGVRFESMPNRQRFIKFIRKYGNWPHGSRVSVPFLVSRLENQRANGPLLNRARTQLTRFDPQAGNSTSLELMDIEREDLEPLATTDVERKALGDVQHWSLLYGYRNFLVHESREPGYGAEEFADNTVAACYHGYLGEARFYLVYSVDLFRSISQAAVDGLQDYFLQEQLDPYDRLPDTSRWCE